MLPGKFGGWLEARVDTGLMLFAFLLSVLVGILFALIPSISGSANAVIQAPKEQISSATKGRLRLRRVMVAAQIALSLVLVCGAGLFARSFTNLMNVDTGFRPEKLFVFSVDPFRAGHRSGATIALFERLQERLTSLPGVRDVALAQLAPMGGDLMGGSISVEGYRPAQDEEVYSDADLISPGYFHTMGIPLVAGREFSEADRGVENKKAIINEAFVRKYLAGRNPIDARMAQSVGNGKFDIEIVGVVRSFKFGSLRERSSPFYYRPYLQRPEVRGMRVFVRTSYESSALPTEVRRVVRETDANMPVVNARWMDAQVADSIYLERLMPTLVGAFGVLTLGLAAVGLYGVIAYLTARRTLEIGIRMALGATKPSVLRLILRDALVLVGAGVLIGTPCAVAAGRFVQSQLFGVQAYDPLILISTVLILCAFALASGYLPARRAAAIDPMCALRSE
jgi:putative ABC transport system permease protein